jgi:hypothetical protein
MVGKYRADGEVAGASFFQFADPGSAAWVKTESTAINANRTVKLSRLLVERFRASMGFEFLSGKI